jgi:intracellular sulfur oxidation DsrE/DsrF family protein
MKKVIAIAIAAMVTFGFSATSAVAGGYGKQKVVYHLNYDNLKRQKGMLRNIKNHIKAVGADKLDLRVVMHGKGYTMLQTANNDLELQNTIISLKDKGVKFQLCANTIRGKKLDENKLFGFDPAKDKVPSGVAEIAHLEKKGFAYIRP